MPLSLGIFKKLVIKFFQIERLQIFRGNKNYPAFILKEKRGVSESISTKKINCLATFDILDQEL
ncbi:MAG TPA: hypothetical protein DCS93_32540 [Microscillaceae bacterium]|nr:hypothetical protein [Microscillaceae bacterium]